jgi:TonB family protein
MEENLILSRVPAYPADAKLSRIEGPVVMQVIITKTGVVNRVHVIEGNYRLRAAAIAAITKQRYRPYLVNGEPVDVATTVTINFKLDQ